MTKADSIEKVAPDLWFWQAYDDSIRSNLSCCAIAAEDGVVLVDPIDLNARELEELGSMGSVMAVVLTNGNHGRSAMRYRKRFNVPILAHGDAVGALDVPVDGVLRPGKLVGGTLQVICLAGGGPGEIALYDPRGRLHLGDALVNFEPVGFSVLPVKYCQDTTLFGESLRRLLDLKVDLITFAHGSPLLADAGDRLAAVVAGYGG